MLTLQQFLIRTYNNAYASNDRKVVDVIAAEAWPDQPCIHSNDGFVIEDTASYVTKRKIVGFIMYQYVEPATINKNTPSTSRYKSSWWDVDFKKHFNSFIHSIKAPLNNSNCGHNQHQYIYHNNKHKDEHLRCMQLNPHLKYMHNWNRLQTHIIHITDIALKSTHRSIGIGTHLLKTFIFSFPSGTRFGLEVAANNHMAINCYQKCGFFIERNVTDYYGSGKAGLKMVLISSYTDQEITQFILSTNTINHIKKDNANTETRMAQYTVRFANNSASDTQNIKRILYTTWPNNHGFEPVPITIVVEETFYDKQQIVAYASCSLTFLAQCAVCDASEPTVKHTHNRWYFDVDFDAKYVQNRSVPKRSIYEELLVKYNSYLNANEDEWNKLKHHFVHIRSFAVDKNHRHKGLGSFMMKYLIHLFPFSTMFGLEVEANNHGAIRLYGKCGFGVNRIVNDYYGADRNAYKMIMISKYKLKDSLAYLKEHQSIMRAQDASYHVSKTEQKAKDNIQAVKYRENQLLRIESSGECVYNIRKMDRYLDSLSVERLLSDKRSWKYLPFMDTKYGFVAERLMNGDKNNKRIIIGFIGYQTMDAVGDIAWINSDFEWKENEGTSANMIYISQFCVDSRYHHYKIGAEILSHFIKSFPDKTGFGTEIETTNESVLKLFIKIGFKIRRTVRNFYDFGRDTYKMTLVSEAKLANSGLNGYFDALNGLQNKFKYLLKQKEDSSQIRIQKALQDLCGDHWQIYFNNFKQHQVFDNDVCDLNEEDLKCLIAKIGPRARFREWIKEFRIKTINL